MTVSESRLTRITKLIISGIRGEEYDYTGGSLRKAVVLLAIPMMLEMCLESVFAVVDIYFVNRLGSHAVSVVGLTEAVITIVYSVAIGLSAAATAVVARRVGEKDPVAAALAAKQVLLLAIAATLILSLIGYFFAEEILRMMGAEEQTVRDGINYTRLMLGASGVVVFLFLINGIFRGAGNAAIAMKSLWMGNALNIVLCPLLINGWGPFPQLGVTGAAMATVIGRGTGVLYQTYHLFYKQHPMLPVKLVSWSFNRAVSNNLIKIAGPATIQFIVQSASWIILAALVARSGHEASAGYQTAIRLIVFFILPAWGISNAAATLVGQNLGAGLPQRAEDSVKKIAWYNTILMSLVMVFFLACAPPLIAIFIKDVHGASYQYAVDALRVISTGYILYGIGMVMMQAFNGAGDTRTPTFISLVGFWFFQIPLAWVLAIKLGYGPMGVFIAIPVAEALITVAYYLLFRKGRWKVVKV